MNDWGKSFMALALIHGTGPCRLLPEIWRADPEGGFRDKFDFVMEPGFKREV